MATYLEIAIQEIDQHLGKGYARENPQLIGSIVLMYAITDSRISNIGSALFQIDATLGQLDSTLAYLRVRIDKEDDDL